MKACDRRVHRPRSGHRTGGASGPIALRKENENYLDIAGLVRSVQRSEGHSDCFQRGFHDCERLDCPFRKQCFERD